MAEEQKNTEEKQKLPTIGILAKKLGMRRMYDAEGNVQAITLLESGPCVVTQLKTEEKDGYNAVQVGFIERPEKGLTKSEKGHFTRSKLKPQRHLKEFRVSKEDLEKFQVGQEIKTDSFSAKDIVDVTGTSKGRGFTGVMKRHGFSGAATQTHGTHEFFRHGGSIGCAFPQHVIKGRKMPGHYGVDRITVQNLEVFEVNSEDNTLLVKGAVPGAKGGILEIRKAVKDHSLTS